MRTEQNKTIHTRNRKGWEPSMSGDGLLRLCQGAGAQTIRTCSYQDNGTYTPTSRANGTYTQISHQRHVHTYMHKQSKHTDITQTVHTHKVTTMRTTQRYVYTRYHTTRAQISQNCTYKITSNKLCVYIDSTPR